MGKFSRVKVAPVSVIKTKKDKPTTSTFEGAPAYSRTAKSDLFLLAITNMVGEDTFYEGKNDRDQRFRDLIGKVAAKDPAWIARFIPFLRNEMQMRSASIVVAAEAVLFLLKNPSDSAVNLRKMIDTAISRADEPAEMLAYVKQRNGGVLPKPVKRGVADAVRRLYNERSALKYDGQSRAFRMADVIDLIHASPKDAAQSALFKFLLDRRHNRENIPVDGLPTIECYNILQALAPEERRGAMKRGGPTVLKDAAFTWETLSGWLPGGMDAEAWEAVIPSMGYMALLRNLRNFEQAKISDEAKATVIAKLTDPEEVKSSRQFPYRFYSAYKNVQDFSWAPALETALDLSVQNIPEFKGRTLVLVDISGSMTSFVSEKSKVQLYQIGALFAAALARKNEGSVDLAVFGTESGRVTLPKAAPALRLADAIEEWNTKNTSGGWMSLGYKQPTQGKNASVFPVGHGTETFRAIEKQYDGQDRIVIFTDGQAFGYSYGTGQKVSGIRKPIYSFNLAGYGATPFKQGSANHYEFGGFTDKVFTMMSLLERGENAGWPF